MFEHKTSESAVSAPPIIPRAVLRYWHGDRAAFLGASIVVLGLVLVLHPMLHIALESAVLWCAYTALFTAASTLTARIEEKAWTGYPHLIALMIWLVSGLNAAVSVIIIATTLSTLLSVYAAQRLKLPTNDTAAPTSFALGRIAITGGAVLAAAFLYNLFGFTPPLIEFSITSSAAAAFALLGAWVTAQIIGTLLVGELSDIPAQLMLQARSVERELLWIGVPIVLALIVAPLPLGLHLIFLVLIGLWFARQPTVQATDESLLNRVQELSMMNMLGETMSSTLVMDALLERIQGYLIQITEAAVVYVALYDNTHEVLDFSVVTVEGERVRWPKRRLNDSAAAWVVRHKTVLQLRPQDVGPLKNMNISLSPTESRYPYILGIPLMAGIEMLGVVGIMSDHPLQIFEPAGLTLVQTFAHQAALAIHNATLYSTSIELVGHLSLINSSVQNMMMSLDKSEAIQRVCETAMYIGQADAIALHLVNGQGAVPELVYTHGLTIRQQALIANSATNAPRHSTRMLADTLDPEADPDLLELAQHTGLNAMIEISLRATSATRGFLTLFYHESHYYTPTELELLQMLAGQISAVIDNAELFAALETYAFEMAQLAHLSRVSTSHLDVDRVVSDVADILCQVMMVSRATIALVDSKDSSLYIAATYTSPDRSPIMDTLEQIQFPELKALTAESWPIARALHLDESEISPELRRMMSYNREATIALIPMMMNRGLLGVIVLGNHEKRAFTEREWQLSEMASNQVAAQIQNAQLYTTTHQALKQRLEQLSLIEDIARQISTSLNFNQIIRNMLEAAVRSTQADYASLVLLPDENNVRAIIVDYANESFSRNFLPSIDDGSLISHVMRTGMTIIIPDTRKSAMYSAPHISHSFLSALAVPLIQESMIVGVLNVQSESVNAFNEEHISFLKNLAGHAVISIGNARMLEERQYQLKVLASLQALALRLSSAVDTYAVAQAILETSFQLFDNSREVAIFRYAAHNDRFTLLANLHQSQNGLQETLIPPVVAHEAAQTGEIQIVQWKPDTMEPEAAKLASCISIPLKRGNRVHEVLCIAFEGPRTFPKRDLDTLSLLAGQAAGHLENATLHEQIRAGNERMAAILNSTRDGVILLDQRGWLVEANPAARQMLGDDLNNYVYDVVGEAIWKQTPDKRATAELSLHAQSLSQPITRRQFERKTAQGLLYIEEIGSPVVDAHNRPVGWLLVLRDVTEEKLVETFRDEITSMVVHDLRGPLGSIITSVSIVLEDLANAQAFDTTASTLQLAADSANSLMVLVESLLDIAKLEAREMPLELQMTPVDMMVERAAKSLNATIQQTKITLTRDIPAYVPPVQVDCDVVIRVLINLLDNALRHTPPGKEILIGVHLLDSEPSLLIRVADSGYGIPPEERAQVFEKFKQAKGSHPTTGKRGTGLGLTFCKLAIEAHGGRIWIEDTGPLSGASFAFTLPLVPDKIQV